MVIGFVFINGCDKSEQFKDLKNDEFEISNQNPGEWNCEEMDMESLKEVSLPRTKSGGSSLVYNGGFEEGFSGWTYSPTYYNRWFVGDYAPYAYQPHPEPLAHSGNNGATAIETGSTYHRLYQVIELPAGQLELSFWMRWKNWRGYWLNPSYNYGQNIMVSLLNPNTNQVIATLFNAFEMNLPMFSGGGDQNFANYEYFEYDISEYSGQTVKLEFANNVCCYFQFMDLDDIEIINKVIIVDIDIMPGSDKNPVNMKSKGKLPVAVLSDEEFDVTTVDPTSVTLGNDNGAETPIIVKKNGTLMYSFEDVDGDGDVDMMMHFEIQDLIANGDLSKVIEKLTFNALNLDGTQLKGEDVVTVK